MNSSDIFDYILVDESGEIILSGRQKIQDIPNGAVLGFGDRYTHYYKNSKISEYTEDQKALKRKRPYWAVSWSNETMSWVDGRSLSDLKDARWQFIKDCRDHFEHQPISALGLNFDADAKSQARIQGAVQLATLSLASGGQFQIDWTLADNSVVSIGANEMIAVGQALALSIQSVYQTARQLRIQIEAATTAEEIEAIVWPE